jgi:hypothetical protein
MSEVNSFERILVTEDLAKRGITNFDIRPGNGAVWVSYGRINCYYVIRDGRIADIIYD